MSRARVSREAGFTLVEVLIALAVTVIGLAGVMIMQATAVRANRETAQFTRAANIAEEVMEQTRARAVDQIGALSVSAVTVADITYTPTITVDAIAGNDNLALVTVRVDYDEEGDTSSTDDDRHATVQMVRTRTEVM